jgi:hypothetical protein
MLLTESEKAKVLRNMILDIVIDVINQKTGGATKYINQFEICKTTIYNRINEKLEKEKEFFIKQKYNLRYI